MHFSFCFLCVSVTNWNASDTELKKCMLSRNVLSRPEKQRKYNWKKSTAKIISLEDAAASSAASCASKITELPAAQPAAREILQVTQPAVRPAAHTHAVSKTCAEGIVCVLRLAAAKCQWGIQNVPGISLSRVLLEKQNQNTGVPPSIPCRR